MAVWTSNAEYTSTDFYGDFILQITSVDNLRFDSEDNVSNI